jgi:ketosteroid isomerase-like protein
MLTGAHAVIYSTDPDSDRAFLRDVLELPHVDVGEGWLIFGLPPAEVAVHPSGTNDVHEFFLICEDVEAFVARMNNRDVACGPIQDQGWGRLTRVTLPGGGKLGVYQPRHARPRTHVVESGITTTGRQPGETMRRDLEADRADLMRTSREWAQAAASGDLERIVSYWADDAVILAPDRPAIVGKAAIRDFVRASQAIPGFSVTWEPEQASVSREADLGYLVERNRFTVPDGQGALQTQNGKAVTVWRKDVTGAWKCVLDTWNNSSA